MKKYKNNIISFVLASILVIFIWHSFLVSGNNVTYIFLFASCYLVIKHTLESKTITKRKAIIVGIVAVLFTIIEIIGKSINTDFTLDHILNKWLIVNFVGYFVMSGIVILWVYDIFENNRLQSENIKIFGKDLSNFKLLKNEKFLVIVTIVLIFLAYLPFFLRYYPGIITSDSYSQIEQMIGILEPEDHHPITHTAIIGIFANIGLKMFNNINTGIALYSIFSMLMMATFAAFVLKYLRKKKVPAFVQLIILLFYMFYPVNGMYSITMWKDILFSGIMPLFIIQNIELIFNTEEFLGKKRNMVAYVIIAIFTILLRHNGLYVVMLSLPFTFVVLRKYWKKVLIMFLSILVIYEAFNFVVFKILKVKKGSVGEMLSVPIQQIVRSVKNNYEDIDEETINKINEYFTVENAWEYYNPVLSDPVKFKFNNGYFEKNKSEFISIWLKLFVKYPKDYIEAFISNSYGYYYPEARNSIVSRATMDHNMGIKQTPLIEGKWVEQIDSLTDVRDIPAFSFAFSIGAGFMLTVIALSYIIYKKKYKYILVYLPTFILWLTLIASPAYCEFRYAYPIFLALPVYIGMNFVKEGNNENGKNSSTNTLL